MSTLVLTTPTNPGKASWQDATTLPGAIAQSDYNFTLAGTPILGSNTSVQAFSYSYTLPAGSIAAGDYFQLAFWVAVVSQNVGVDAYRWGIEIGGQQQLYGPVVTGGGNPDVRVVAPLFIGFDNIVTPPPLLDVAGFNGAVVVDGNLDTSFALPLIGIDPSAPIDVKILWEWQAGTDPASFAQLFQSSLTVFKKV